MPKNVQMIVQLHTFKMPARYAQNSSSLGFSSMRIDNFQKYKLDLKKAGTWDQVANICWITEKARDFQKKPSTSASLTMLKPLTVWITTNYGKFLEMEIPDHLACLLRILYAGQEATVRKGHGTMDWFQIRKGVCQGCILSPFLFNLYAEYIMWNLGWMKHKLESRLPGEISITSDRQMTPPLWQKVEKNQRASDESERGEWKSWLKAEHSENCDLSIWSHHFMANRWGNSDRLYFEGLQNHCRLWLQPWN